MSSKSAVWAVIPARGGSIRVENKNAREIGGKPLISWALESVLDSGVFHEVIVNTDSEEIAAIAGGFGARVYRRPETLGGNRIFIIDVIKEMIDSLGIEGDSVLGTVLPTCPLRTGADIAGAYALFEEAGERGPVASVTTYETPIQLALLEGQDGTLSPFFPEEYGRSTRSTDHRVVYKYNEAIIFNRVKRILRQTNLIGDHPVPYVMPPERSLMIDYHYQFDIIDLLLKGRNG